MYLGRGIIKEFTNKVMWIPGPETQRALQNVQGGAPIPHSEVDSKAKKQMGEGHPQEQKGLIVHK